MGPETELGTVSTFASEIVCRVFGTIPILDFDSSRCCCSIDRRRFKSSNPIVLFRFGIESLCDLSEILNKVYLKLFL